MYQLHKAEIPIPELVEGLVIQPFQTQNSCFDKLSNRFVHLLHNF
ncbi:hypothetical protein SC1083_1629 [Aggregatibacter actinomycetemcomitans serotype e str. SC1083]|uniref:Uncharacterized protein n=1 Tax=Aggregatibacter actinomycetemcomitans serotype e str. SC1083 TaxID=907488 RepID=G4A9W0_AGGAC|nr:hypothetical protein SC1083_1629 [Aggregatibacter actinomycetemcomitans serotype e str. SC1083]